MTLAKISQLSRVLKPIYFLTHGSLPVLFSIGTKERRALRASLSLPSWLAVCGAVLCAWPRWRRSLTRVLHGCVTARAAAGRPSVRLVSGPPPVAADGMSTLATVAEAASAARLTGTLAAGPGRPCRQLPHPATASPLTRAQAGGEVPARSGEMTLVWRRTTRGVHPVCQPASVSDSLDLRDYVFASPLYLFLASSDVLRSMGGDSEAGHAMCVEDCLRTCNNTTNRI